MTYTLSDAHKHYGKNKIEEKEYKDICNDFNAIVLDEILLEGKKLMLGSYMSFIQILKIKRLYGKPTINWPETNKLKAQGIKKLVYYTDEHYFMWYWNKEKCKVKNKTVYRFKAARGLKGAKTRLNKLLKKDDLAYLNFEEREAFRP
jgi:hypothetical protein